MAYRMPDAETASKISRAMGIATPERQANVKIITTEDEIVITAKRRDGSYHELWLLCAGTTIFIRNPYPGNDKIRQQFRLDADGRLRQTSTLMQPFEQNTMSEHYTTYPDVVKQSIRNMAKTILPLVRAALG